MPYVAAEFVDAPTLGEAVAAGGPLLADEVLRLGASMAAGLAALSAHDLVIGDLKPARVAVTETGARFVDFGVARARDRLAWGGGARRGQLSSVFGAPAFISPELALGNPLTAASDVFACAGLIIFAATGRPPFGFGGTRALLQRTVYTEPDLRGVPVPLAAVLLDAMRKNAARRIDAAQLAARLLELVDTAERAAGSPAAPEPSRPAERVALAGLMAVAAGLAAVADVADVAGAGAVAGVADVAEVDAVDDVAETDEADARGAGEADAGRPGSEAPAAEVAGDEAADGGALDGEAADGEAADAAAVGADEVTGAAEAPAVDVVPAKGAGGEPVDVDVGVAGAGAPAAEVPGADDAGADLAHGGPGGTEGEPRLSGEPGMRDDQDMRDVPGGDDGPGAAGDPARASQQTSRPAGLPDRRLPGSLTSRLTDLPARLPNLSGRLPGLLADLPDRLPDLPDRLRRSGRDPGSGRILGLRRSAGNPEPDGNPAAGPVEAPDSADPTGSPGDVADGPDGDPPEPPETDPGDRPPRLSRSLPRRLLALVTPARGLGALVIVTVLAITSVVVADQARTARDASTSRRLAAAASQLLPVRPDLAGQLAVAAFRIARTPQSAQALVTAAVRETPQAGGAVHDVALSDDGATLLTAGDTGVGVWDLRDPSQVRRGRAFLTGSQAVLTVTSAPVGSGERRLVATGGADRLARLWDLTDPARPVELATLRGATGAVNDIAFTADGRVLATAETDGAVRLWDVADLAHPRQLAVVRLPGPARGVAFSPDGRTLAVGAVGFLRLWDVTEAAAPRQAAEFFVWAKVDQVRFSPDGDLLAAATTPLDASGAARAPDTGDIQLYQLSGGRRPRPVASFGARPGGIAGLVFSLDGRTLFAGGADGEITMWDMTFPDEPSAGTTLKADGSPRALVLSSAGRGWVLAAVGAGAARVWELDPAVAAEQVCARVGTRITQAEWLQAAPGRAFRAPCP
ncbi:hypothetical protein I6A84_04600 [Frankia sp. CNm7]|uniref:protein kinase domain-containing protein n=1 Tax=Frankia nepalensis TaxID=1836974 RepID=UPI0019344C2F|nr:hypothetical protein [Frankia nepalensis]MBL7517418.1 hypothetical protein [Frankia nepalensis]